MSTWALWLCMFLLIGTGIALDVPFVFDEASSGVASYNSNQIVQSHFSSPDLIGVPTVTQVEDNEILAFPVTGGGSAPERTTDEQVGELKKAFDAAVEPDNSRVHEEAVVLALKYPGDLTIDQIASIYSYLKNGDGSKKGWGYVRDPRGIDYFNYANASLKLGDRANYVGGGDCDDFAILMAALVESIGGTTRIILARNNSTGGHAYTEVYLGQLGTKNSQVEEIINWLKQKFNTDKIYTHIDTDTKDVWLNMDWGPDEKGNAHPGGPFFQGDMHIVLCIRDTFVKTPLKLPEKSNKPPKLTSLTPEKPSQQYAGTAVTWTAEARDPDNDQIQYQFFLNDEPVTKWQKERTWAWATTENDAGENQIEVKVRDGKHAGPDSFDSKKATSFTITTPETKPIATTTVTQPSTNQSNLAEDWVKKGNIFLNESLYDLAIKAFDEAILIDPNLPEVWYNKGRALDGQLNYDEAIKCYDEAVKCYDEAIRLNPKNDELWYKKGIAFDNKGCALLNQKNSNYDDITMAWDEAVKAYDEAIRLNPNYAEAWYKKAVALMINQKGDEAIKAFDEATRLDPKNAQVWYEKGSNYMTILGDHYDEAIKCYDEAISIDPNFAGAWSEKGNALRVQGKYDEAIKCFDEALRIDPKDSWTWGVKGWALFDQGKYDESTKAYDEEIRLNPNSDAWSKKAEALDKQGKYDEALQAYDEAIKISPDAGVYWEEKGNELNALGRTTEAEAAFAKSKELFG